MLLPDELQRIHYLARRQVLQSRCLMHADEHNLLALYLDTGFNLVELEDPTTFVAFDVPLAKKEVDPYLDEWFAGRLRREPPKRRLQPAWRKLLRWLQTDRPPDWVTIGMALLDASAKQQQDMLELISCAVRTIRGADGPSPIDWWTMDVGLLYWRSTIMGIVTKDLAPEDRVDFVFDLVERQGLNETSPCTALLFDVAVDRKTPVAVLFFPARNGDVPR